RPSAPTAAGAAGISAFLAYTDLIEAVLVPFLQSCRGPRTASMSFYQTHARHRPFEAALAPFLQADGLPFADVLPAEDVLSACDDEGVSFGTREDAVFNPALTLWAFLSQVLAADKSCRAAVLRVVVLLVALERGPCSADTAA